MKNIAITCFVLIAVCVGLQAKKVVKAPYFMATNTSQIEFEKVTLGKDTTWIDAKIYSIPGEDVRIDSTAVLQIGGKTYAYLGAKNYEKHSYNLFCIDSCLRRFAGEKGCESSLFHGNEY